MSFTKVDVEDTKSEVEYWESAVGCYILGASPPFGVLSGFVKRSWVDFKCEKIVMMKNDILLVKFDFMILELTFEKGVLSLSH